MEKEIISVVVLAMIALLFVWAYRKDVGESKSVSASFRQFAEQHGFTYFEQEKIGALGLPADSWFISQGDPCDLEDLVTWNDNGVELSAFRFFYIHKHTDKRSWGESIICLRKEGAKIPWFRSFPKNRREDSWWHSGWERIHPHSQQNFFQESIIKSKHRQQAEQLFSASVIEQLHWFEDCIIEGIEDYLIIISNVILAADHNLKDMASRGIGLMNAVAEAAEQGRKGDTS